MLMCGKTCHSCCKVQQKRGGGHQHMNILKPKWQCESHVHEVGGVKPLRGVGVKPTTMTVWCYCVVMVVIVGVISTRIAWISTRWVGVKPIKSGVMPLGGDVRVMPTSRAAWSHYRTCQCETDNMVVLCCLVGVKPSSRAMWCCQKNYSSVTLQGDGGSARLLGDDGGVMLPGDVGVKPTTKMVWCL